MANPRGPTLGILAVGLLAVMAAAPSPALAQEECATCHEDVVKKFAESRHGRSFTFDKTQKAASCTSCHGAAEEHVNSGGEVKLLNPARAKAAESNAACLTCHENDKTRTHWQGSPHEAAGVKCASCHSVHGEQAGKGGASGLPEVNPATAKCLECHTPQRKALNQRSRHPLRDGKLDCVSCHNPHGSEGEKLVAAASVNDMCYSCHQEKRGPFLWEHSPVRENCLTCHTPHGSNHPTLLAARITQTCQACHQQGRHQTLPGVPQAVWNTNKQCVSCHAQIHGSNHPSGPLFQR